MDDCMIYSMNTSEILLKNVEALMKRNFGKTNLYRTSKESNGAVSVGSLQRIQKMDDVGVKVLSAIADFFEVQVWHLFLENLDVNNPPVILQSKAEQEFYSKMKEASKQLNVVED